MVFEWVANCRLFAVLDTYDVLELLLELNEVLTECFPPTPRLSPGPWLTSFGALQQIAVVPNPKL